MFVSLLLNNLALFTVLCIGLGTLFADMDTGPRLALVPSPYKRRGLQVLVAACTGYGMVLTTLGSKLKTVKTLLPPVEKKVQSGGGGGISRIPPPRLPSLFPGPPLVTGEAAAPRGPAVEACTGCETRPACPPASAE
jgi:hypothetical protein